MEEAERMAGLISSYSVPIVGMAKEAVNKAYELSLNEGLDYEKKLFYMSFGMVRFLMKEDRKEGMTAFAEKRAPVFKNK